MITNAHRDSLSLKLERLPMALSSYPNGIVYFWLSGQLLCKAQRREHSRSYVTVVVTPHDCMDAGARRLSENRLPYCGGSKLV